MRHHLYRSPAAGLIGALGTVEFLRRLCEFHSVTPILNPRTHLTCGGVHERAGAEQVSPFIMSHYAANCHRDDAFTDF